MPINDKVKTKEEAIEMSLGYLEGRLSQWNQYANAGIGEHHEKAVIECETADVVMAQTYAILATVLPGQREGEYERISKP